MKDVHSLREHTGLGIFDAFLTFETDQFNHLAGNTLTLVRITPAPPDAEGNTPQEQTVSRPPCCPAIPPTGIARTPSPGAWRT